MLNTIKDTEIGEHFRAHKKYKGGWKGNINALAAEEIPMNSTYTRWKKEASKIFGGLDICALDAVHCKDGKDWIIELNGSGSGLNPAIEDEDLPRMRDMVLKKIEEN